MIKLTIDAQEVEAEAWEELTEGSDDNLVLEEKYGNGSSSDVDGELKRLMEATKKD